MRRRGFLTGVALVGPATLAWQAGARPRERAALGPALARQHIRLGARITRYRGATPLEAANLALEPSRRTRARLGGTLWSCDARVAPVRGEPGAFDLWATFTVATGRAREASVAFTLAFEDWSREVFVTLPGACYAGNRFESRRVGYPALLSEPADIGPNVPTIVPDIPRLNLHAGPSRIQLRAGDLATAAIGVFDPRRQFGLWMLTDRRTIAGETGLSVEEDEARTRATLIVSAPSVRQDEDRARSDAGRRAPERGADFAPHETVVLRTRLVLFDCADERALFARLTGARRAMVPTPAALRDELPLSAAFRLLEERLNQVSWVERPGYYATTRRTGATDGITWQTGWGGGLVASYPLLAAGTRISRQRALRTLAFALGAPQARSGFFRAASDGEHWYDDGGTVPTLDRQQAGTRPRGPRSPDRRWHLIRRSGEALYWGTRHLQTLGIQDTAFRPQSSWLVALGRCAAAFVRLWERYQQLGQFVDVETGDVIVGGSCAGAIVPGALALWSRYAGDDEALRVAQAAAEQMYDRHLSRGVTTGASGDALQAPDSEAAAGLLESFVALHDVTLDARWMTRAADAAHLFGSWVVSNDLQAPPGSTLERLRLSAGGAVLLNAQSRTATPGPWLYSGAALLRVFRATGERAFLDLLRETVHNTTQYVSLPERPLHDDLPPGAAAERLVLRDGGDGVGDVVPGIGPAETPIMLAAVDVPGVYVQPDARLVVVLDHVEARLGDGRAGTTLSLRNPTRYEATVRVLTETATEAAVPLGPLPLANTRAIVLAPGASERVSL